MYKKSLIDLGELALTQQVNECLMAKWAGNSVTSSKTLKCQHWIDQPQISETPHHFQKHYGHGVRDMYQYQEKIIK